MTATGAQISHAVEVLRRGGVVAFPTETVYGLGADARNRRAVARVYALKGRPADHPVIVHLASADRMGAWAREVPHAAWRLAERFWPGALTLVLPRAAGVLDAVTGGQDTVALRVPSHPVAHALLVAFGGGVAAPSANRFGRVSATTMAHVHEEFGDALEVVLDGGEAEVGIESTIVDLSGPAPRLLRPGGITLADLEAALASRVLPADAAAPRAPGTLAAHYAPRTPLRLVDAMALEDSVRGLVRAGRRIAVLARGDLRTPMNGTSWWTAPPDPAGYAHALYANLRALDRSAVETIVVEAPPETPLWLAVNDRLRRAAAGAGPEDEV